jgi:predicted PilT family ATPase
MELKLAKTTLNEKSKTIQLDEIEKAIEKEGGQIFYFSKDNPHKNLVKLAEYFEEKNFSVYLREVRYGLSEGDFMYEVHIL